MTVSLQSNNMDQSPKINPDVKDILQRHADATVAHLKTALKQNRAAPLRLIEAIEYSLLAGGKRLRPALVLESFTACAPSAEINSSCPYFSSALSAAAAIELVHTFSLVHDDLPAMDDDDLRRGRPTNHKVFGEALAILAGDSMLAMAFEILATGADPSIAPQLIAELAQATGPGGMIGGQVLDMAGENQSLALEQLQQIHRLKTGSLLTTGCRLGAIAAGASPDLLNSVTLYGQHIGLAFQIVDDILDVTSTPDQLGKATHKDAGRGKNTYPALLGLEPSRAEARRQLDAAFDALSAMSASADGLRAIANFVLARAI
jgi:geranylgeranyl diphosphate synthase, type II